MKLVISRNLFEQIKEINPLAKEEEFIITEFVKSSSETWQEQFDEEFTMGYEGEYLQNFKSGRTPEQVKHFISNLLQERDKELVERIKKARAKGFEDKTILESIETDLLFRHHN